ncbi:glutamine--fructose-6-phosphate transaminase (isomerizing) [bacterium]|nr:glutamine--fructose-6-phosphate transaminase (isomerizing) [bacterium]
MCGIVGYIGDRDVSSVLIVGLERLSYRGYDSSGISVISEGELSFWKKSGKIHELSKIIDGLNIKGSLGIGHTRWATHGIPNDINSHPHLDKSKKISIVHNGIIENFLDIKEGLIKEGYVFRSQTDTEVIVHLVDKHYKSNLVQALAAACKHLKGSYGIAMISELDPDKIIVARSGSPLIIGKGQSENFVSSDINTILPHTKDVIYLEDNQFGVITKDDITIYNNELTKIDAVLQHINWDPVQSEKGGHDHFMHKEIHEQPAVVRRIISKYVDSNGSITFKSVKDVPLEDVSRFIIQSCGTSWHAGLIGRYLLENYAKTPSEVDYSSEFRYRRMISKGKDMVLAISQSGETADTLAGIREAKSNFFPIISFVNVKNSSIDRESDAVIYSHSGQEVGVASTKNYISQLTTLYLFSLYLGVIKKELTPEQAKSYIDELNKIPDYIESILAQEETIKTLADKYYLSNQFLFIGRGINFPSALEGALKLKEISYVHATGYAAGELKHGPIALIDSKLPIVCIAPNTSTYDKMLSNIQEVKSRKGKTIIVATEGNKEIADYADDIIYIPKTIEDLSPLLVSIPLQLLSYYIAIKRDCDVDQPRNLAKSVTVE